MARPLNYTTQKHLWITDDQAQSLSEIAAQAGISEAEVIRSAIRQLIRHRAASDAARDREFHVPTMGLRKSAGR